MTVRTMHYCPDCSFRHDCWTTFVEHKRVAHPRRNPVEPQPESERATNHQVDDSEDGEP